MAQLQGYTLLIEAYHARNDIAGATTALNRMNETITEQVLQFTPLVEQEILWLNKDCSTETYCPYNDILADREFPFIEASKWYQHKGWNYVSKFEKLDQDINLILGSMKTPSRYVSFTARVMLWPQECFNYDNFPKESHDFANGLPLTFINADTGIEYTVTGTKIDPQGAHWC